jgi:tetratricopeptide (TPR) repeat protein
MKFKLIYLYGILAVAAIIILVIISQQNSSDQQNPHLSNNQTMPEDDIHKKIFEQGNTPPSKENVSEEYKKRLAELKEAVEKNPKDTVALKNYAEYLSAAHKMDEAIGLYEKILSVDPKRTDIHFALSIIYFTKKDLLRSEAENIKVLSYDPNNQMALYNLGAVTATRGNITKAKEFWEQVIEINSGSETGKLAKESLAKL